MTLRGWYAACVTGHVALRTSRVFAFAFAVGLTACLSADGAEEDGEDSASAVVTAPESYARATGPLRKDDLYPVIRDPRLPGLRYLRPVLTNALYRGGGPGGQVALPAQTQTTMCQLGFRGAVYHYPNGYRGSLAKDCKFQYDQIGFRSEDARRQVLSRIHTAIKEQTGAVLVHCWNGWHASGEIAALALKQFCGWSDHDAGEYWKANIGDQGNLSKYGTIVGHIERFRPFPEFSITAEEQARVCPQ